MPTTKHTPGPDGALVTIRRYHASDPVPVITALLHRAYAKQVQMGLRPLAGRQDDGVTQRRLTSGEAYLATIPGDGALERIVGVIILNEQEPDAGPPWFLRPEVGSFSQFAVDPGCQKLGIGRRLLDTVEARARRLGRAELALSMAEPDHELRDYYLRRGYRVVSLWKWPYTNYDSLIMSKRLVRGAEDGSDDAPAPGR